MTSPARRRAKGAPAVVGLDLSLTSTGIARPDGTTTTIASGKLRGPERLDYICRRLHHIYSLAQPHPTLTAVEGYAYGRHNQAHQAGELGGLVRWWLWKGDHAYIDVAPTVLKKYATGKGNATKEAVLVAAVRALGYGGDSTDEADAAWLRAFGLHVLGAPVVEETKYRTELVAAVAAPKEE